MIYNNIMIDSGDFIELSDGRCGVYQGLPIYIPITRSGVCKIYIEDCQIPVGDLVYYNRSTGKYSGEATNVKIGRVIKVEEGIVTVNLSIDNGNLYEN